MHVSILVSCHYANFLKVIRKNFFFKTNLLICVTRSSILVIKNMKTVAPSSFIRDPDLGAVQIDPNFFKLSSLSSSNILRFQDN